MTFTEKEELLKDLQAVRERCVQLPHLNAAVPADFFVQVRNRIEVEADRSHPLKLPVLFFFLERSDLSDLQNFEGFLAYLKHSHHRGELRHLIQRLLEERDYRQAAGAIFEVEVLAKLLSARGPVSVNLYPKHPTTQNKPDACISLGQKTIYIEITLLSQTKDQEKIQDLGVKSLYEQVIIDDPEMEELGIRSVPSGVVSGVGDPYGDALRVIGKLEEKRKQLVSDAPNIISLGLPDLEPGILSIGWAAQDFFSGSPTMAQAVLDRYAALLINKMAKMSTEKVRKIEGIIQTLKRLICTHTAEPRLTGLLTFQWKGNSFSPKRVFRNPSPGSLNGLSATEWKDVLEIFGLPLGGDLA